jgi:hypothetical protein
MCWGLIASPGMTMWGDVTWPKGRRIFLIETKYTSYLKRRRYEPCHVHLYMSRTSLLSSLGLLVGCKEASATALGEAPPPDLSAAAVGSVTSGQGPPARIHMSNPLFFFWGGKTWGKAMPGMRRGGQPASGQCKDTAGHVLQFLSSLCRAMRDLT